MNVQWVALGLTFLMAVISIVTGLYQSSQSKTLAAASEKVRADISNLMIQILDRIDRKLDDYVRRQNFLEYSEGHAKEHLRIEDELVRLRDGKK